MKKLLSCLALSITGLFALGCSDSRRNTTVGAAPVTTVSVVFIDNFSEQDRQEIVNSVLFAFRALLEDYPEIVGTPISYNINVVNSTIEITIKNNKFLVSCGPDNSCPGLYKAFCIKKFGPNHPDHSKCAASRLRMIARKGIITNDGCRTNYWYCCTRHQLL